MRNRPASRKYAKPIASESMVLNGCIRLLWAKGIYCFRFNTGAHPIDGTKRYIRYGTPGGADIIGILPPHSSKPGVFLAVETKSERGKQTDKQKAFQQRVEESGGVYLLVHSVDELAEALNAIL